MALVFLVVHCGIWLVIIRRVHAEVDGPRGLTKHGSSLCSYDLKVIQENPVRVYHFVFLSVLVILVLLCDSRAQPAMGRDDMCRMLSAHKSEHDSNITKGQ